LHDGCKTVRIQGEPYQVRARIRSLDLYSGHADAPALQRWVEARGPVAGEVFLAHGEPDALEALRKRLVVAGLPADGIAVPSIDQAFELDRAAAAERPSAPRLNPSAPAQLDWHNARSELLNQLEDQLDSAPDDVARADLIGRLQRTLAQQQAAQTSLRR
jgi:metallo-beta-lactamase family protein